MTAIARFGEYFGFAWGDGPLQVSGHRGPVSFTLNPFTGSGTWSLNLGRVGGPMTFLGPATWPGARTTP